MYLCNIILKETCKNHYKDMKTILIITLMTILSVSLSGQGTKTFHDFTVTDIDGNSFPLSQLKGKKVLVVNVASKCGLTPQYEQLEALYKKYGGEKFTIIGFPANNFMGQEPGTEEEIKQFCESKYGVTFLMMSKISVKGKDIAPVYQWLTEKKENGVVDAPVSWNFQKFMVDESGKLTGFVPPKESPMSDKIISWIESK